MLIGTPSAFQRRRRIVVCAVACYGNRLPPGVKILLRSAMRHGIAVHLFGMDRPWHNFFVNKIEQFKEDLRQMECDHVLMVDAADVVFARGLEEIMDGAQDWDRMTFNAEQNCYPDPDLAKFYPECGSSFKYLNAGIWLARHADAVAQYDKLYSLVEPREWAGAGDTTLWGDDQWLWTRFYLAGERVGVDTQCRVFQTLHMVHDGELVKGVNEETGERPCIYHANGQNLCSMHYQVHC